MVGDSHVKIPFHGGGERLPGSVVVLASGPRLLHCEQMQAPARRRHPGGDHVGQPLATVSQSLGGGGVQVIQLQQPDAAGFLQRRFHAAAPPERSASGEAGQGFLCVLISLPGGGELAVWPLGPFVGNPIPQPGDLLCPPAPLHPPVNLLENEVQGIVLLPSLGVERDRTVGDARRRRVAVRCSHYQTHGSGSHPL